MRLDDLDLRELLDYRPEGGLIHFAGRRVVLLDVVALLPLLDGPHRSERAV